jgi:hypothetical protein
LSSSAITASSGNKLAREVIFLVFLLIINSIGVRKPKVFLVLILLKPLVYSVYIRKDEMRILAPNPIVLLISIVV